MVVLIGTLIAYFMTDPPFALTGTVDTGVPSVVVPPFTVTTIHNETLGFGEMMEHVGAGFGAITLIGIIEVIAVSKAFGKYFFKNP